MTLDESHKVLTRYQPLLDTAKPTETAATMMSELSTVAVGFASYLLDPEGKVAGYPIDLIGGFMAATMLVSYEAGRRDGAAAVVRGGAN